MSHGQIASTTIVSRDEVAFSVTEVPTEDRASIGSSIGLHLPFTVTIGKSRVHAHCDPQHTDIKRYLGFEPLESGGLPEVDAYFVPLTADGKSAEFEYDSSGKRTLWQKGTFVTHWPTIDGSKDQMWLFPDISIGITDQTPRDAVTLRIQRTFSTENCVLLPTNDIEVVRPATSFPIVMWRKKRGGSTKSTQDRPMKPSPPSDGATEDERLV